MTTLAHMTPVASRSHERGNRADAKAMTMFLGSAWLWIMTLGLVGATAFWTRGRLWLER